jgi:endonuclease I
MNKSIRQLLLVVFVFGFLACEKEEVNKAQSTSEVVLNLDLKGINASVLDNHLMEIRTTDGVVVKEVSDLENIPDQIELASGNYEAVIFSELKAPAFDQPLYGGKQNFTVSDKQTTSLSLTATQANFGVKVVYADDFKAGNTNYSTVISSADGSLTYSSTETRLGYFVQGPITITLTYTDGDGAVQTEAHVLAANHPSIAAGTALTIQFKGSGGDDQNYTGYYADATGKTGLELKSTLTDIISDGYRTRSYDDLWGIYQKSDIRKEGNKTVVWDMYSHNPAGAQPYTYTPGGAQCGSYRAEGDCYNREHSVPKSWFNKQSPMVTDMVHLVPTDGYVNGRRSNYPFGEVSNATWTSDNGCKVGPARNGLNHTGTVFEPIDEYKGDFARIYFYFVTRYADRLSSFDGGHENEVFNSNGYGLDRWTIDMFLEWSKNDPVSDKERNRNEHIEDYQGNRNPYVDHPEFINKIWGQLKAGHSLKNGVVVDETILIYSVN